MSVQTRTVFVGDNLPVLRGMEAESVDMVYAESSRVRTAARMMMQTFNCFAKRAIR